MKRLFLFTALAVLLLMPHHVAAQLYNVQENPAQFGNLNQSNSQPNGVGPDQIFTPNAGPNNGVPQNTGNNYCAPTATMNAFSFLQSLPDLYNQLGGNKTSLTGANPTMAAQTLAGGTTMAQGATITNQNAPPYNNYMGQTGTYNNVATGTSYMMTSSNYQGTSDQNWASGFQSYLNNMGVGGLVSIVGMDGANAGGLPPGMPSWVAPGNPTLAFLQNQMTNGEATVLGVTYTGGGGHVLTMTGLSDTGTKDGMGNEIYSISVIDPANPGAVQQISWTPATGATNYGGGATIDAALAASVPELDSGAVASSMVLVMGVIALTARRRRSEAAMCAVTAA